MTRTLSPTSTGRVMWAVAASDGPVTASEVAAVLGANKVTVSSQLLRLHESGCLVRRKRYVDNGGGNPYEYEVLRP